MHFFCMLYVSCYFSVLVNKKWTILCDNYGHSFSVSNRGCNLTDVSDFFFINQLM